jgi:uncharacterized protein YecT (DUF1311 family)
MKRTFGALTTGLLLISSQAVFADTGCDKHKTSYDRTYCLSKLFVESDAELNAVYKDLRSRIKKSTGEKLKSVQLEWIQYRDASCQPQPGTITVDCSYELNHERTGYLRDRLRECKTGVCQDAKIAQKHWN